MKKTKYRFIVTTTIYLLPVYRRVWTDGERFFIKYNGKLFDMTDRQDEFVVG